MRALPIAAPGVISIGINEEARLHLPGYSPDAVFDQIFPNPTRHRAMPGMLCSIFTHVMNCWHLAADRPIFN